MNSVFEGARLDSPGLQPGIAGRREQPCRRRFKKTAALAAAVFFLLFLGLVNASASEFVTAQPSSLVKLRPGQSANAEFRFHVGEGYHINSSRPKSDLLIPTELTLDPAPQFTVKDLQYPLGKELRLSFDPAHPLSVYSGDFSVQARLIAAHTAAPGRYQLSGELRYQACSDRACYPPKRLPVNLEVEVLPAR